MTTGAVKDQPGDLLYVSDGDQLHVQASDWSVSHRLSNGQLAITVSCGHHVTPAGRLWGTVLVSDGDVGWACVNGFRRA